MVPICSRLQWDVATAVYAYDYKLHAISMSVQSVHLPVHETTHNRAGESIDVSLL